MGKDYELQTDTHLSKDFNKVLQSCMIQCNSASMTIQATPHFEYLKAYYGTINNFFKNTFHLFGNVTWGKNKDVLMTKLIKHMMEVKNAMDLMRLDPRKRTHIYFQIVVDNCDLIHMMIMYGLQRRNMLVRMSESEPKGIESIEHWRDKEAFKKGDLNIKTITTDDIEEFII